jgi:hypothetical protein
MIISDIWGLYKCFERKVVYLKEFMVVVSLCQERQSHLGKVGGSEWHHQYPKRCAFCAVLSRYRFRTYSIRYCSVLRCNFLYRNLSSINNPPATSPFDYLLSPRDRLASRVWAYQVLSTWKWVGKKKDFLQNKILPISSPSDLLLQ